MTNFCVLFYICIWKSSSWAVTEGCVQYRISALPETLVFGCKSNTLLIVCILAFTQRFLLCCEAVTSHIPPLRLLCAHQKAACLSLRATTILKRLRPGIWAPLPAGGPPPVEDGAQTSWKRDRKQFWPAEHLWVNCGLDWGLLSWWQALARTLWAWGGGQQRGGRKADRHGLQWLRPRLLKLCLSSNL